MAVDISADSSSFEPHDSLHSRDKEPGRDSPQGPFARLTLSQDDRTLSFDAFSLGSGKAVCKSI